MLKAIEIEALEPSSLSGQLSASLSGGQHSGQWQWIGGELVDCRENASGFGGHLQGTEQT